VKFTFYKKPRAPFPYPPGTHTIPHRYPVPVQSVYYSALGLPLASSIDTL